MKRKEKHLTSWMLGFFLCFAAVFLVHGASAEAGTVNLTMTEGDTKYLFPRQDDRDFANRAIHGGGWVSYGFEYVEVISDTSVTSSCQIRAKKETFSPIILRLDYYYWMYVGTARYLATGYVDYKITVVAKSVTPSPVNPGPSVIPGTGTTTQNTLKGITLSKTELSLTPGTRQRIYVQKEPSSGNINQTVFTSTDKTVANVDQNGTIYGIREGKAVIKATANGTFTAECKVTVTAQGSSVGNNAFRPGTSTGNYGSGTNELYEELYAGESMYLRQDAGEKAKWTSSAPKIASVSANGRVKARKAGMTTITAATADGRSFVCRLNVKPGFSVSKTKVVLSKKAKKTVTLTRFLKKGAIRIQAADRKCVSCRLSRFKGSKAKLTISGKKKGKTSVILTHTYSGEKKKITVTVK